MLAFNVEPAGPPQVLANGIRNCVGPPNRSAAISGVRPMSVLRLMTWYPIISTRVRQGASTAALGTTSATTRIRVSRVIGLDLAGRVTVPDVPYRAHSAVLHFASTRRTQVALRSRRNIRAMASLRSTDRGTGLHLPATRSSGCV